MPRPLNTELGGTGRNDGSNLVGGADLSDTSDAAKGDALVGVKRTATGAVATTQHEVNERTFNVFDFLSEAARADVKARSNSVDVTSMLQAAIDAAGDTSTLYWPEGSYKTTATLVNNYNWQAWIGAGRYKTQIYFAPTVADTCVELGNVGSTKVLGSLSGFGFYSDNSTVKKVAIDLIDISNWTLEDIGINGGVTASSTLFWSGASSVGLRTRGKDTTGIRDLFIAADLPIQISVNPNLASISIDHFNFHNCYLLANANPQVTIDTAVVLSQVSFTGFQSWVLGTSGVKWNDTTSSTVSNGLILENVRCEQSTDSTQYLVDIAHNTGLQNLVLRGCTGGTDRRTAKLRKVDCATFENFFHTGTLETINADSTVKRIVGINCFWQASSTATLTGQRLVYGVPKNPNTGALPPTFIYDEAANGDRNEAHDGVISATPTTLANLATAEVAGTSTSGLLIVIGKNDASAIFFINGGAHSVNEISDPSGVFSVASGTASSTNVYWSAGNSRYEIENRRGISLTYVVLTLGSYS